MPVLEHDGATLAYDVTGGDDAPTVLLLPGLSSARSTWAPFVASLAPRLRVVRMDHRGHGDSSHVADTYDVDHYGPDAAAVLAAVAGEPAIVVGHSLGGVVAHWLAVNRPELVRGIFLEDPPLYLAGGADLEASPYPALFTVMRDAMRAQRERDAPLEEYVAGVAGTPAMNGAGTLGDVLGEAGTLAVATAMASLDPDVFTPAIEGRALTACQPERRVSCPVHVLQADPALGAAFTPAHAARFADVNPHATITLVEGASHLVHDEQPDRFLAEVLAFADRL